jgi:chromosome partitioning protein
MAKIISIVNFKGGVGKTTITVNLAAALAKFHNKRVLIIDMDPQMNATGYCLNLNERWDFIQSSRRNIYFAMLDWVTKGTSAFNIDNYIIKSVFEEKGKQTLPTLDLLPGAVDMIEANKIYRAQKNKGLMWEFILSDIIKTTNDYDFILIDTSPSLGGETKNAIIASHGFIVPFTPEPFVQLGLEVLIKCLHQISFKHETYKKIHLQFLGVVFTKYMSRLTIHKSYINNCIERLSAPHMIHYGFNPKDDNIFHTKLSNKSAYLKSVRDNSPMCFSKDAVARKEIQDLTEELLNRIGG